MHASRGPNSSPERILLAAKSLFAEHGYEHATTAAIAKQAGTSESQLIKHFGSKAGVLEGILTGGWLRITVKARKAIKEISSPVEKLMVISGVVFLCFEEDPELRLLTLFEGRRIRKEAHQITITDGFLGFVGLLDEVWHEMEQKHLLRPNLHPQAVRTALMSMLEGLMRDRMLAERRGFPAIYGRQEMLDMVQLMMKAVVI